MNEYKIIKILDSVTYVANIPLNIVLKDKNIEFIIYYKGEEIIDPDTNNSLGNLEITKERCFLVDTQEKFTIVRDVSERSNLIARSIIASGFIAEHQKDMTKFLPDDEKKVKVGDYIKIIRLTTAST